MSVNGGNQTVPTLLFPDGSAATNPSIAEVGKARLTSPTRRRRARAGVSGQRSGSSGTSSGPPNQCSMIRRAIEMPPGTTTEPSAIAADQLVAGEPAGRLDLVRLRPQVGRPAPRREAEHQRGGERPGLVAQVGHVGDLDADLLGHLAGDRRGQRLPRLDEAGEHRHPVAAPARAAGRAGAGRRRRRPP